MSDKKETYKIYLYCQNCEHEVIIKIPLGVKRADFFKDDKVKCPHCECSGSLISQW